MYSALLRDPEFFVFLTACDRELAAEARNRSCSRCGGRLHRANFPRKPRGGPEGDRLEPVLRYSFCCAREGCRHRATPGSLRFLGRRVYWGAIVILALVLRSGVTPLRAKHLQELIGVSARTLGRWRQWWQSTFAGSSFWKAAQGRLREPVASSDLPHRLLACFSGDAGARVVTLLRFLASGLAGPEAIAPAR